MAINRTVQAIFDKAMYLIDAQHESTGATVNRDTKEYQVRTIGILNNLLDVVYPASDTFSIGLGGSRPALDDIAEDAEIPRYYYKSVCETQTWHEVELHVYEILGDAKNFANWKEIEIYDIPAENRFY